VSYANFHKSIGGSGLHEGGSAMHWKSVEGQTILARRMGPQAIAGVHEQVQSADREAERQFTSSLGPPRTIQAADWGGAWRSRHVRMNPDPVAAAAVGLVSTDGTPVRMHLRPEHQATCTPSVGIAGKSWHYKHSAALSHKKPDIIRTKTPNLLIALTDGDEMTAYEKGSARSWLVHNSETGEDSLPTREHFLHWMGLRGSAVHRALDKIHPCMGLINANGTKAIMGQSSLPCGQHRICNECNEVIARLGKGWHLPSMVDACTMTLLNAMMGWMANDHDVVHWRYDQPVHHCEKGCKGLPVGWHPDVLG
jgi:hypothetical protein